MNRRSFYPFIFIIIGLATFGLFFELFTNTSAFLSRLFITALTFVLVVYLFKKFFGRRYGSPNRSQRLKPKRIKYSKSTQRKTQNAKASRPILRKRSQVNLTVIEGRKNKKKNRAHF